MFNFKPKFLYMYEGVGNTKGYENEIQYCIPSFSASNLYYLKDSPPPFVFDVNNENTKYFFAFDHITDSYAYIDFGGARRTTAQSGSERYSYRKYNQGKMIGNTFYWYSKSERKGSGSRDPIEDADDGDSSGYQFNSTGLTYYWLVF